jgi:hypothetical protein
MPHYEATVRVLDVEEPDASTAKRVIEERLRAAGFSRWQVVHLGLPGAVARTARRPQRLLTPIDANYAGGALLVAAVVAWALWFLWLLAG